ncbi:MAG: response regulator transcription factor [Clostridia bacterium]|nr:response regulator transcription factor [Clostridia bacterium]
MRILVVEDEVKINNVITKRLQKEGYSVDSCYDGEEATDYLNVGEFDAVILDIMMPKKDGLSVLREMRAKGNDTPVLLLTAKDAVQDRVAGLDSGAEDYLVKPFAFEELLARIRVIIRKSAGNSTNTITVGDLVLDTNAKTVQRAGKDISLTAKEYDLLEYLMINKGIVLSREKIENHIWNFDYSGGTNVIDVYILYLRKKIDAPFPKKLIHTVKGKGYVIKEEQDA